MMRGDVTPVFFGSAMTNFGVELFLDRFVEMGSAAGARGSMRTARRDRTAPTTTSRRFVFKIQANMDPRHRDRVAFVRICSGRFERDMTVRNVRTGKDVRLTRAMKLFANERESIDVAYAGDVVGLANPGTFAIGDTLCDGARRRASTPIPAFEPEHFALVRSTRYGELQVVSEGHRAVARRGRDPSASIRSARRGPSRSSRRSARCSSRS